MIRSRAWMLLACAACAPSGPTADSEVAAELRALRAALQQRATAAPAIDASMFTAGLAPLREVLEGLASSQRDLQQRQVALTQEMQRWSQLLVDSVSGSRRDEASALSERLRQLEGELAQQQTRHQEVEALMQGALERTADRLEALLRSLEPAAPPPPEPVQAPTDQPPNDKTGAITGPSAREPIGAAAWWWWIPVLALGVAIGAATLMRWRAVARRGLPRQPLAAGAAPGPGSDPGVQEIWAAAALLGEAVGRLRESTTAPADETGLSPEPRLDGEDLADLVVLDDELLQPDPAAAMAAEQQRAAPPQGTLRTPRPPSPQTCLLRTADPGVAMQAVLQVLEEDPRVLRRPQPTVRCGHDTIEVTFRLLPDLPPGERSHLEQRLRDACG